MCFDTVENKLSILHLAHHKSLPLPSHSVRQRKLEEQWTQWENYCFKITLLAWDICKEALPSKHPTTYLSTGKDKGFPVHTNKVLGGTDVQLRSLLMLTLDGGEWAISHPGRFTHGKEPK
jgi:hypothetical protein